MGRVGSLSREIPLGYRYHPCFFGQRLSSIPLPPLNMHLGPADDNGRDRTCKGGTQSLSLLRYEGDGFRVGLNSDSTPIACQSGVPPGR